MIRLHQALAEQNYKAKMILQVHDELVLEVPAAELDKVTKLVVEVMEAAYDLKAPLKADTKSGINWLEM